MANEKRKYWDRELETLPRKKLEALQLRLLKEEVLFAYGNSPFYRAAFDDSGVDPQKIKGLADIRHFPFTI